MVSYILQMLEPHETSSLLQPFSFTLVVIFLIFLCKWSYTRITTTKNSPPSPPKLPVIGNLHQLGLHPHRSFQTLSPRHGLLMLLHFGSVPVLVVSSAETAREIMKTHDLAFSDRPKSTIYEKLSFKWERESCLVDTKLIASMVGRKSHKLRYSNGDLLLCTKVSRVEIQNRKSTECLQ